MSTENSNYEQKFNVGLSIKYGIIEAILLENFRRQIFINTTQNQNYHSDRYWFSATSESLTNLFPYLTRSQIRISINKLILSDLILRKKHHKERFDQTCWYAFTDKGLMTVGLTTNLKGV